MSSLTPMLLLNGSQQYQLNGVCNKVASIPVNSNVVSCYLFAVSSCPVIDLSVVPSGNATDGTIADIHRMYLHGFSPGANAGPAWADGFADMWSNDQYRSFQPDSVAVTNADVYLYGNAGYWAMVYLMVLTRATA